MKNFLAAITKISLAVILFPSFAISQDNYREYDFEQYDHYTDPRAEFRSKSIVHAPQEDESLTEALGGTAWRGLNQQLVFSKDGSKIAFLKSTSLNNMQWQDFSEKSFMSFKIIEEIGTEAVILQLANGQYLGTHYLGDENFAFIVGADLTRMRTRIYTKEYSDFDGLNWAKVPYISDQIFPGVSSGVEEEVIVRDQVEYDDGHYYTGGPLAPEPPASSAEIIFGGYATDDPY